MKSALFSLILSAFCASAVGAAADPVTAALASSNHQPQNLALKRGETLRDQVLVPVNNPNGQPLHVEGAQTTGGLFVRDFPRVIPPNGSANVDLIYVARDGAEGKADLLTLLTDQGMLTLVVEHGREEVVSLDSSQLLWDIGEAGSKSVVLTITGDVTMPKVARVAGRGNGGSIERLRPGVYRITITPASTTAPMQFPVFIDFDPSLPGVSATINCYVGVKPEIR